MVAVRPEWRGCTLDGLPVIMMPSSARTRRRRSTRSSPSEGIISGATPAEIARARTYLSPTVWNGWPSTSRTQAGTPTRGREDFLVIGNLVVQIGRAHVWTPVTNVHLVC